MKFVMRSEAGKDIAYDLNRAEGRSRIAWIAELVGAMNVGALIVLSAAVKREEIRRGIGEYAGKFGGDIETAIALKEWHESEAKRLEVGA